MTARRRAPAVPHRIAQTADLIGVRPGQRVLEIGVGRGVLAALICGRLGNGQFVGIDRSGPAIAASIERNKDAVARGLATFEQMALEDVDPGHLGRFDTIVAVNVNLFWTRPASHELGLISQLLAPTGTLWLVYEAPDRSDTSRIEGPLRDHLEQGAYEHDIARQHGLLVARAALVRR